jgi:hypothetical protein
MTYIVSILPMLKQSVVGIYRSMVLILIIIEDR